MALRYLLDTNALIELLRGRGGGMLPRLDEATGRLGVSAVTVAELDHGVEHADDPAAMRADLTALLTLVTVLDFDREAARHSGLIRQALASAGTPIGPYDVLIAGHARSRGLTLVTHNTREFSRVPGLAIEDWQV